MSAHASKGEEQAGRAVRGQDRRPGVTSSSVMQSVYNSSWILFQHDLELPWLHACTWHGKEGHRIIVIAGHTP